MNILKYLGQLIRRFRLVWLAALLLLWWAFKDVPWVEVVATLGRFKVSQILILVGITGLVLATFSLRLWILLRAKGHSISLVTLTRYWLVGFAVSYFTPGPQLGGGPFQIYLLSQKQPVSLSKAVAAVVVSKILERVGNAIFLLFGLFILLQLHLFPGAIRNVAAITALILLILPVGYLIVVWQGKRPISSLFRRLPARVRQQEWADTFLSASLKSEEQIISFCRDQPYLLLVGIGLTLLSWGIIIVETWLILVFFGIFLSVVETIAVVAVAQLAFLFPTPAGLGALEAGLAVIFRGLGYPASIGVSLALVIRARDILLGTLGLALGGEIIFKYKDEAAMASIPTMEDQPNDSPNQPEKYDQGQADEAE